jgi:hypothetical protein
MSKINIVTRDDFLELIRNLRDNGELSQYVEDNGDNQYKIALGNPEVYQTLTGIDGQAYDEYDFLFSLENRVDIEQTTNYNAISSFNILQEQPEQNLKSVYQLTTAQLYELEEDFKNQSYDILTGELESLLVYDNPPMSLTEKIDKTSIYRAKDYFPFRVDFRFTDTKNSFYKTLVNSEAYELMVELFHKTPFQVEQVSTDVYGKQLLSLEISDLLNSGIPTIDNFRTETVPSTALDELSWGPEFDNLEKMILQYQIGMHVTVNAPTYKSMVFGDKKTSFEIICYKIEKYKDDQPLPVQVFYVPASDSNRDFSDTQVYFGNVYHYRVHAIGISLSSSYIYSVATGFPFINKALLTVTDRPTAKFFQFEILTKTVKIDGIAPTVPEVSFLNRSNEEARMRFYFEPSVHEEREQFLPILESDSQSMSMAKKDIMGKTIFRLNQDVLTYQIFKLNNKPKSYDDFVNALAADVIGTDKSSSEVYEMYLTPNRKFYFTFRAKNGFNLFSNPTPIYEVELIQDADETRVSVKTINLTEDTMMRTKTFGRFLRIYPSFDQLLIREYQEVFDEIQLNDEGSVVAEAFTFNNKNYFVGNTDHPIWGKKMKFRVRSRNTGKIVDINVDFVLEKKETEADF